MDARLGRMAKYPQLWPFEVEELRQAGITYTGKVLTSDDISDEPEDNDEPRPRQTTVNPSRSGNPRMAEAIEFIRDYHGTFGLIMDLKADQWFGSKYFKLSDRQIDVVLASKAREAQWAQERQAQAERSSQNVSRPVTTITQDGFYKRGDDIFKVQVAVHGSGNLYAKRLIVHEHGSASWEYAPGVVRTLREDERLTLEQAQEFGRLYGVCGICGRTLTDEGSIADGIGPICAGKQFGQE